MTGFDAMQAHAAMVRVLRLASSSHGDDDALRAERLDAATPAEFGRVIDAIRQAVDEELGYPCTTCGSVLVPCGPSDEPVCSVCDSRQCELNLLHERDHAAGVM